MGMIAQQSRNDVINPLDLLEEIVGAYDWTFERASDDELTVGYPGQWCDYALQFTWRDDVSAMNLACALDTRIPAPRQAAIHELLAVVNAKMWVGHFDLAAERGLPVFRQAVLLRGPHGASVEQLEDLVEIAICECERFYPAFQYVAWGGKTAAEAVEASMIETVGEA